MSVSAVADVLKNLNKRLGSGTLGHIGVASEVQPEEEATFIPLGYPAVDFGVLVNGGIPMGGIVELYGAEGGGKSTMAMRLMGQAQRSGLVAALIDVEQRYGTRIGQGWLTKNGVNINDLVYSNQNCAEYAILEAMEFIESGVNVVVLDSVAALVPKDSLPENLKAGSGDKRYEEFAEKSVASLARSLGDSRLNALSAVAAKHKALVVFVNQIRDNIGVKYGDTTLTPGGHAVKHACIVRLAVEKKKVVKESGNEDPVGVEVRIRCTKSCYFPPWRATGNKYPDVTIWLDGRTEDPIAGLVPLAVDLDIITKPNPRGYALEFLSTRTGEVVKGAGKDAMVDALREGDYGEELNERVRVEHKRRVQEEEDARAEKASQKMGNIVQPVFSTRVRRVDSVEEEGEDDD